MADVTVLMGDEDGSTITSGAGQTEVVAKKRSSSTTLTLRPEPLDFLSTDGQRFTLQCGDIIGVGGEGCVVRATDGAGREYAAKIAYIIPAEQANTESILQLLFERTRANPTRYQSDHLMPVYAWGTIFAQPLETTKETELLVTIMPRCTSIEHRKLTPSQVKAIVLPQLAEAVKALHDLNIVHRDVKPANVYLMGDDYTIVLGDFGISTLLEGGENVRDTRLSRRTPGYTPHVHFVVKENDWYALGYTLWTLYNDGVHPHQRYLEEEMNNHESATLVKVMIGERPVSFKPREAGDETFGQLIYGLTTVVVKRRLGYEDIQGYLADPAAFHFEDSPTERVRVHEQTYVFEGETCHNNVELAYALSQKWERAKLHLYTGNITDYLAHKGEHDLSTRIYEIVERDDDTITNQDLGLSKVIWMLSDDQHMLYWKGIDVSFPTLVDAFGRLAIDELARYDEALASGVLSWSLSALSEGSFEELPLMQTVEEVAKTRGRFARCLFNQLFVEVESTASMGASDFEGQVKTLLSNPHAVYELVRDEALLDEELAALAPVAASLGTLKRLTSGRAELAKKMDRSVPMRVEQLLVLLEAVGQKSDAVRTFTLSFGPKSAWLWLVKHVDHYEGLDQKAKLAVKKVADIKLNEEDTVLSIMKTADLARHQSEGLVSDMPITPLHSYLGYDSKVRVSCDDVDGYFCSSFYGDAVPRGFVRELLLATPEEERERWAEVQLLSNACRERASKAEELITKLKGSAATCNKIVPTLGTTRDKAVEIALSAILLVLSCVFLMRQDFVNIATDSFARTLSIAYVTLPPYAGPMVKLCAWSVLLFSLVNLVVSIIGYKTSDYVERKARECQSLHDRAKFEKDGFASGESELAAFVGDPMRAGAIRSLYLYDDATDCVKDSHARASIQSDSRYKFVWSVTSILPVVALPLYYGWVWVGSYHAIMNGLLAQFAASFRLPKVPTVDLGSFVYLLIIAATCIYGYLKAWGKQKFEKRDAQHWLKLVALSILRMLLAFVITGLALMAIAVVFTLAGSLFAWFTVYAASNPVAVVIAVVVIGIILKVVFG